MNKRNLLILALVIFLSLYFLPDLLMRSSSGSFGSSGCSSCSKREGLTPYVDRNTPGVYSQIKK